MKNSIVRLEAVTRFKAIRLSRGESADEFGEFLDVSGSTVHRWENPDSDSNPSSRSLLQICIRCDVSPTWLFFGLGVRNLSDVSGVFEDARNANDRSRMADRIVSAAASLERLENVIDRLEVKVTDSL